MPYWSNDRTALTVKMWREGYSASQIAAALGGVTRNAVIGKVHRLGLSKRVEPKRGANIAIRARAARGRKFAEPSMPREIVALAEPIGAELGAADVCKFILGPVGSPMCGRPEYKRSCCEAHFKVCYQRGTRQCGPGLSVWVSQQEKRGIKRNIPGAGLP